MQLTAVLNLLVYLLALKHEKFIAMSALNAN